MGGAARLVFALPIPPTISRRGRSNRIGEQVFHLPRSVFLARLKVCLCGSSWSIGQAPLPPIELVGELLPLVLEDLAVLPRGHADVLVVVKVSRIILYCVAVFH